MDFQQSVKIRPAMRILYSMLCEMAQMREDGRLDVEGIFSELRAPGFPAQQEKVVLVAGLEWDQDEEGKIPFELRFRNPKGEELFRVEVETDIEGRTGLALPQTRLILPLERLVFPQPGPFRFVLLLDGHESLLASVYVSQKEKSRRK